MAKGEMNLRCSAAPPEQFVPKPASRSSHTPLLGIKSPDDIYMGKLCMCSIVCTKEEQDILKGSGWETADLQVSAPQKRKPLVSCMWCFTPGDKLHRTCQLLVLSRVQNSLLLPHPSYDSTLTPRGRARWLLCIPLTCHSGCRQVMLHQSQPDPGQHALLFQIL